LLNSHKENKDRGGSKIFNIENVISIKDFKREDIKFILDEASKLEKIAKSQETSNKLFGKILGIMFFEASTRTRLSFETAMKRLGGNCIGFTGSDESSIIKGETIADTSKMFESYSDAIVIRHPLEGVAKFISDIVDVPVINAGDGTGQHPTQTLLDLYTIKKEFGKIKNLNIALIGDLKYGRTVHSLSYALGIFGAKMHFISPNDLKMPDEVLHDLKRKKISYHETNDLKGVIDDLDILYVTRIQKERFPDVEEYEKIKGAYIIDKNLIEGKNLIVMHPLPRTDEIHYDIDDTKYNKYFNQAFNGVPVRMAILKNIIKINK
jgi:aspartate carbamoyltransferase catalytic subunit